MNKKLYKEECKKMEYSGLLLESLSLKETIGRLNDLKEKAQKDNEISYICNIMNKRAECYEKLRIVEDELKSRIKEE